MEVKNIGINQKDDWNEFAAQEVSFALLQSWQWGEFKEKMGWKVFRTAVIEQGRIIAGAQMLIRPLASQRFSIAYIPRGPIGSWVNSKLIDQLFFELHHIAKNHHAIYLKIEPPLSYDPMIEDLIKQHNFFPSSYNNQPRASITIDLKPNLDEILHNMRPTTRQRIKSSALKGVNIRVGSSDDISAFDEIMRITGKRAQFPSRTRTYYEQEWKSFSSKNQCVLLMAYYQNQLLAVHMAFRFGEHAAFFHGGSLPDNQKLHPNHLLVWEAIKWAKQVGCQTYDLWGIPDEVGYTAYKGEETLKSTRSDGLWGVYEFKSGFSKNVEYYLGAYDYIYNSRIYKIFANRFINDKAIDRVSSLLDKFSHK